MSEQSDTLRVTAFVRGEVQGVGFRWWTSAQARELGLVGYAKNLPDGRVEVLAQGDRDAVRELVSRLSERPSTRRRPGHVDGVTQHDGPPVSGHTRFEER